MEALAQLFVLCGDTDRTSVHVAFAHHHTSHDDQGRGGKAELFGTEQGHQDNVATCLDLAVGLHLHQSAEVVENERLLCLCQSDLGRKTRIADRAQW